jgi:hypothetical protein
VLLAVGRRVQVPSQRWWRRAWLAASAAVALLFAATLVVSRATPFVIVLAWESFALAVAVLHAPALAWLVTARVWPALVSLTRRLVTPAQIAQLGRLLRYAPYLAATVLVVWGVSRHYDPNSGFTRLIAFGSDFSDRVVPALRDLPYATDTPSGYDGQFYAQLAFDPLLLHPDTAGALDNTAYRGRRVLVPAAAWVLGAGYPPLILQVYALLNVGCWLLVAWLLAHELPPESPSNVAVWMGCLLSQGMLMSMRLSLTDGPSMLLLVAAVRVIRTERHWTAAGVLALAGLARETNVLGLLGLPLTGRDRRTALVWLLRATVVAAPIALWIAWLWLRGYEAESGARNFAVPLSAYAGKWSDTLARMTSDPPDPMAWYSLCALIALPTQALVLVWLAPHRWHDFWWRTGIAFAALMLVLGPAVWEGHPGAVTRALLPMTFAFNLLLPRGAVFWPLWVLGNLNLAHSLADLGVPLPWI